VHADDRVRVIDRAAQHALELRLADAGGDPPGLLVRVGDGRVVALGRPELEVLRRLADRGRQGAPELDLLRRRGALAEQRLRAILVAPEARLARQGVELFYLTLQSSEVKETPLAHRRAA
jgi:hypothetical protein